MSSSNDISVLEAKIRDLEEEIQNLVEEDLSALDDRSKSKYYKLLAVFTSHRSSLEIQLASLRDQETQAVVAEIPKEDISKAEVGEAVDHYSHVGKALADNPHIISLRSEFTRTKQIATAGNVLFFYAIIAPSGSGKTQLPFALHNKAFKTIHLVMKDANSYSALTVQPIYKSVQQQSVAIYEAANHDVSGKYEAGLSISTLETFHGSLRTVSVILQLLGVKGPLEPLKLSDLIKHVEKLKLKEKPVFFLDEVSFHVSDGAGNVVESKKKSIVYLIRNLLRLAGLVVVLMGTDMSSENIVSMGDDSRGSGVDVHWCRLISALPKLSYSSKAALGVNSSMSQIKAFARAQAHTKLEVEYLTSFLNFLQNQFRACIPLFAELFVLAWQKIIESKHKLSVDELVHLLLHYMSCLLYKRKDRLRSYLGIHAQYALQLNRYHIDPRDDVPELVRELEGLQSHNNRFVAAHFASIVVDSAASIQIGEGITYLDLYLSTSAAEPGLRYGDKLWVPLTLFSCARDDALLYILLGGGRTIQFAGSSSSSIYELKFPPPFLVVQRNLPSVCLSARSCRSVFAKFYASHGLTPQYVDEQNNEALTNSKDPFESIGSVALILASHTNGMCGLSLQTFLPAFVQHLSLWSNSDDKSRSIPLAWSPYKDVWKFLDKFSNQTIPYLSPICSDFPDIAYDIPRQWWYLGLLSRAPDKDRIDVKIEVRCDERDVPEEEIVGKKEDIARKTRKRIVISVPSASKRPRKLSAKLAEEEKVEISTPSLSRYESQSSQKAEEDADIAAGTTPTTAKQRMSAWSGSFTNADGKNYWKKCIMRVEMKHHKDVLQLSVLKKCLQRVEGVSIYILLCCEVQGNYFTEKGSWSAFCDENEHCRRLNAVRVVVDNDSARNPTISLDWLSEDHMPPVKWHDCDFLFIVIEVSKLNFCRENHEKE